MKSKIFLVKIILIAFTATLFLPIPLANAATYTVAQVIAWSSAQGDIAPQYSQNPAYPAMGGTGAVTGQIRDTDGQPWPFPSNVTIISALNYEIDPYLLRITRAEVLLNGFVEFPNYESYTFTSVKSSTGDSYKTLLHYKVGPHWYTGQSNNYHVNAGSYTTADIIIRPAPYYLCMQSNDYSVQAGQEVTFTFTLLDVRNYIWTAQTGSNPCSDAGHRSANYTIDVYNGQQYIGRTSPTNSNGQATLKWTAPGCSYGGQYVTINAYVTGVSDISSNTRIYVEPCTQTSVTTSANINTGYIIINLFNCYGYNTLLIDGNYYGSSFGVPIQLSAEEHTINVGSQTWHVTVYPGTTPQYVNLTCTTTTISTRSITPTPTITTTTATSIIPVVTTTSTTPTLTSSNMDYIFGVGGIALIIIIGAFALQYSKMKKRDESSTGTLKPSKTSMDTQKSTTKEPSSKRGTIKNGASKKEDVEGSASISKPSQVERYRLLLKNLENEHELGKVPEDIYQKLKSEYESKIK